MQLKWRDHSALSLVTTLFLLRTGDPTLLNALQLKKKLTFHNHLEVQQTVSRSCIISEQAEGFQFIELEPIIINHDEIGLWLFLKNKRNIVSNMQTYLMDQQLIGDSLK